MPFCPSCKYEYREGITECPDCGVALVDDLSGTEKTSAEEPVDEELVTVFSTNDPTEAAVVKDMLESSGISAVEQPGMTFYGRPTDSSMEVRLSVFKSKAEEAAALIEQANEENDANPS